MEFLTVKETAQLLRVSSITVRRYIASGQLAAERVGRGIRLRREAIEEFVTAVEPASARRAISEHPATILDGLGISAGIFRSGEPTNIAEHTHEYLAEAYGDLHDVDDLDPDVLPGKPTSEDDPLWSIIGVAISDEPNDVASSKHESLADGSLAVYDDEEDDPDSDELLGKPFTKDDPLWEIVGIGRSDGPNDVASNKHKYLVDAIFADKFGKE